MTKVAQRVHKSWKLAGDYSKRQQVVRYGLCIDEVVHQILREAHFRPHPSIPAHQQNDSTPLKLYYLQERGERVGEDVSKLSPPQSDMIGSGKNTGGSCIY